MSVTSGRQPPQPVPALVQVLTSSIEQRFLSRIADSIWDLLTLLQEQIWASLLRLTRRLTPLGSPKSNSPGAIGSASVLFASSDKAPYSVASPTRMPPRRRVPSRLKTSFLYVPLKGSS